jgi:hypothetical protein
VHSQSSPPRPGRRSIGGSLRRRPRRLSGIHYIPRSATMNTYLNTLNGKAVGSDKTFESINPATGEVRLAACPDFNGSSR